MGKLSIHPQNSFNSGEWSPRTWGRFDHAKYSSGLKYMENFLGWQTGGGFFRPGTVYSNEIKDSTLPANLIPFQYSSSQAYQIELGSGYFRFYSATTKARLESGGVPVELVTPYGQSDIFGIHYVQKEDTMYLTKGNYHPKKLIRKTATSFSIFDVPFVRGPFRDTNVDTGTTIAPDADTGTVVLTVTIVAWATDTPYIVDDWVSNGGLTYRCVIPHVSGVFATDLAAGYFAQELFFKPGHAGSLWRIKSGVVKIGTPAFDGLTATGCVVQAEPTGAAGNLATGPATTADWAEGAFSTYRGFPPTCAFHEGRLYYALGGTIYGSVNYAYDNFKSGSNADDAVTFAANSDLANTIRWIKGNYDTLQMGNAGGTASASGGTSGITPTSIGVKSDSDWPAATLIAKRVSSFIMYLQSNTFNLRELVYNYIVNRNIATDMNKIADHILRDGGGVTTFDRQISPGIRFWCVRADGQLAVLTRNQEEDVMGWCRLIGGTSSGLAGLFEAISVNQQDGADDLVWVIVKRVINGHIKRYVEYFSPETFTNQWEPVRLDCSLTYNVPVYISGITQASPGVVTTSSAHGFSNGDKVRFDLIKGMTDLNGNKYIVANSTTYTFTLQKADGTDIDSSLFGKYVSGGEVRKYVTQLSNLLHLEGETVSVVTDGALPSAQQTYTVSGGTITLLHEGAVNIVGLPYVGKLHLLPIANGGTTLKRKIYCAAISVVQSLNMVIKQTSTEKGDNDELRVLFNEGTKAGHPPALYTGLKHDINFESDFVNDPEIVITQDQPLPLFITSIILKSEIEDKVRG